MSLNRKTEGFTADDLRVVGRAFGIRAEGRAIAREVADALAGWIEAAEAAGVPEERAAAIQAEFRLDCVP